MQVLVQVRHELLTGIMTKLETELASCERNTDTTKDKVEHLSEMLAKLEKAQNSMDEKLKRCGMERKAVQSEVASIDKAFMKASAQNVEVEEKMMSVLGDHTTVEKGSSGTAKEIQHLRKSVRFSAPLACSRRHESGVCATSAFLSAV